MTLVVLPPFVVRQRAWERALMLKQERWDELTIEQRVYVEVVYRAHPDGLGWHDIARMVGLYRAMFDVRV